VLGLSEVVDTSTASRRGNKASLLPQKQIGSVHFALKPGLSWSEAEAIAEHLNKVVEAMCVRHLAGGEG